MDTEVYLKSKETSRALRAIRRQRVYAQSQQAPEPVVVRKETECHVTPKGPAKVMAEYTYAQDGSNILEPQVGTGNLVSALLEVNSIVTSSHVTAVEIDITLCGVFRTRFPDCRLIHSCFLEYASETADRFDAILTNPPFSKARRHIKASYHLLNDGGEIIALVPITFEFEDAVTIKELPRGTFPTADVFTKIISITK